MPAVISDTTRKNLAKLLLQSAIDSDHYIGVGKSDVYDSTDTTATPLRSIDQEHDLRSNLQAVKKVQAKSFVVRRYNWSSGQIYSAYSDTQVGLPTNPYYVMNDEQEVFICLQQSKNSAGTAQTSVVKPTAPSGALKNRPFSTADGYVWKFLYQLSAGQANSFLTSNFLPVEKVIKDSSAASAFELTQLNVQNTAGTGNVIGIELTAPGSGYSSAPTVTIRGNGSGCKATATLNGSAVGKIELDSYNAGMGTGYDYAEVIISGGGSGAKARAVLTGKNGIGKDPRDDLKANSIMFNIKPDGAEGNDFIINNSFRQIGLFKGLLDSANNLYALSTGNALRSMKSANAANLTVGRQITDGGSPATKAIIDKISGTSIFYHQNDSTGFGLFDSGSNSITDGINTITIDSANIGADIDPYSGEVLYVENRAKVLRSSTQTEDIKVVITV